MWLSSHNVNISSYIQFPTSDITLVFVGEKNPIVYMYHIFLVHFFGVRRLGWFCNVAIVNGAVVRIIVRDSTADFPINTQGLHGAGLNDLSGLRFL